MLEDRLVQRLTSIKTLSSGERFIVVRPGLALAIYYTRPLHRLVPEIEKIVQRFFDFIPQGAITAICGSEEWSTFTTRRLMRQLKQLNSADLDYTNIDLSSGEILNSEGPYGWHLNGGNLSNVETRPNNTNVLYCEFPHDEIERVGQTAMLNWVIDIAESAPFETAQFGYSFNQLQRTWSAEADGFIGGIAMRYRGFDILAVSYTHLTLPTKA
jgi:hypothetical protein